MDSSVVQNRYVSFDNPHAIVSNDPLSRYKKWLNKSKITDRELPDSRQNRRSNNSNQEDEVSSAQTKPRMKIRLRIISFDFPSRTISTTCYTIDEPREKSTEGKRSTNAQSFGTEEARANRQETRRKT